VPRIALLFFFFSILTVASQGALAFEFAQGVIVDPTASIVYLMNLDGGINAVALSDGTVLTTTPRAAKPLLLYDGTLLAQAEGKDSVLSLVGLRAKDLEPTFTVDVPLPREIRAPVGAVSALRFTRQPAWRPVSSSCSGNLCNVQ
jgi:hypothetical protein